MEINQYAPVIITTLHRYNHFKRCLESLEKCTDADKTEVYVGFDYPPSEKYKEGWEKIRSYLNEKGNYNHFKKLHIIRRSQNYGATNNINQLVKKIREKYSTYILSEEDNEFSPNFLEYMNKGLEKYKDDNRILRICGYCPPVFKGISNKNIYCNIDVPAYGTGNWTNKKNQVIRYDQVYDILKSSFWNTLNLFNTYPALIYMAVHMAKTKSHSSGDVILSMTNLIKGTCSVCPSRSLVRNWGADGSGLRSGIVKGLEKEEIQTSNHFSLDDIEIGILPNLKKRLFYRNMPKNKIKFILYYIYKLLYTLSFYFFYTEKKQKE